MLELYHSEIAACAMKARFALAEKQLHWKKHLVDLMEYEHREADYLKVNPSGLVPTLVHNELVITETDVLLEYLEDQFPQYPLRPASPYQRANMRMWMYKKIENIHFQYGTLWYSEVTLPYQQSRSQAEVDQLLQKQANAEFAARLKYLLAHGIDQKRKDNAIAAMSGFFAKVERNLSKNFWLAGDEFSLADICAFPYINSPLNLVADLWQEKSPATLKWLQRMRSRPAFVAAISSFPPASRLQEFILNAPNGGCETWTLAA